MLIVKFAQSCFKVSQGRTSILIDPGIFDRQLYQHALESLADVRAVLISHRHPDHCDLEVVKRFAQDKVPIFANNNVASLLAEAGIMVNVVEPGDEIEIAEIRIKTFNLPHCKLLFCRGCNLVITQNITTDKKCSLHPALEPETVDGPENLAFLIDGLFFHPGDSLTSPGIIVKNAAVPIAGPTVNYQLAWQLALSLKADRIIPIHYSNPKYQVDPSEFAKSGQFSSKVHVLDFAESLEI